MVIIPCYVQTALVAAAIEPLRAGLFDRITYSGGASRYARTPCYSDFSWLCCASFVQRVSFSHQIHNILTYPDTVDVL